jgi:hypothetical protein
VNAEIRANNEKFEVLESIFVSRMDIHQARTKAIQEEINGKMDNNKKKCRCQDGRQSRKDGCQGRRQSQ